MKLAIPLLVATVVGSALTGCASTSAGQLQALDQSELTAALLPVESLPPGFNTHETLETESSTGSYCNYATENNVAQADLVAARYYSKGIDKGAVIVRSTLRQYASADDAASTFAALTETMQACTEGQVNGETASFSVATADPVGEKSIVINTVTPSSSLQSGYSLNGPVITIVTNGGATTSYPELTASLLPKQVDAYVTAATPA